MVFYFSGTADLSAEEPVITSDDTNEWAFVVVPDHTGVLASWTFDVPILTGAFSTPAWGVKAEGYTGIGWSDKNTNKPQSSELEIDGGIKRGDIYNVTLTFEAL